jgi:predicted nucleic acid-binding protein
LIAYLDSSVLLRLILGQPGRLKEWRRVEAGVASALVEVECLRTLDRLRFRAVITDDALVERREATYALLAEAEVVEPTHAVLRRASQPFPTSLGTLDAIHLTTALMWSELTQTEIVMATHDAALAAAARASGLRVMGS